jgi:hypothetical protein
MMRLPIHRLLALYTFVATAFGEAFRTPEDLGGPEPGTRSGREPCPDFAVRCSWDPAAARVYVQGGAWVWWVVGGWVLVVCVGGVGGGGGGGGGGRVTRFTFCPLAA